MLVASYRQMLGWYEKLAPLQDKIFRYMQQELEDLNEADRWKLEDNEDDQTESPAS
jgi:hypothetical protein